MNILEIFNSRKKYIITLAVYLSPFCFIAGFKNPAIQKSDNSTIIKTIIAASPVLNSFFTGVGYALTPILVAFTFHAFCTGIYSLYSDLLDSVSQLIKSFINTFPISIRFFTESTSESQNRRDESEQLPLNQGLQGIEKIEEDDYVIVSFE
jgi:hypothetical protein